MLDSLMTSLYLCVPLVISGIFHMTVVTNNWWSVLARPISKPLFGSHKTWRGFVVIPLTSVIGVWIAQVIEPARFADGTASFSSVSSVALGFSLGFAYALAELPNSFFKRRKGVAPGMLPDRNRLLFLIVDQTDSVLGCAVVYYFWLEAPVATLIAATLVGPTIHLVANLLLYSIGLRKRPV